MTNGEHLVAAGAPEISAWDDNHDLKLYRGEDSARQAELETSHISAARRAGLQVPVVKDIIAVNGRYGIIFERIEGPTLYQELVDKPHRLIPLARILAEVHVEMHTCTAPDSFGGQNPHLQEMIAATTLLTDPTKQALLADLAHLPNGNSICHGNFHSGSVILTYKGPVVINWLDATQGNQHLDIARTILRLQPIPLSPAVRASLRQFTIATAHFFSAVYLQRYAELSPISFAQVSTWQRLVAAAQLVGLNSSGMTLMHLKSMMMAPIEAKAFR